jgi:hypothetical protein
MNNIITGYMEHLYDKENVIDYVSPSESDDSDNELLDTKLDDNLSLDSIDNINSHISKLKGGVIINNTPKTNKIIITNNKQELKKKYNNIIITNNKSKKGLYEHSTSELVEFIKHL